VIACCPRCRLLQPAGERCVHCGDVRPLRDDEADQLLKPYVESVQVVAKPPPGHGRGGGLVLVTFLGMVLGAFAGEALLHSPVGALAGMALGTLGYRKHFWRMVLIRKPKLPPVADPKKPISDVTELVGTAKPFEGAVASAIDQRPCIAVATCIRVDRRLVLRAVRAAPFWLVSDAGRRVLITGACWVASEAPLAVIATRAITDRLAVPPRMVVPRRAMIDEARVVAEDRIVVTGLVREEHLVGLGYRDQAIETMRGEAGRVVWIERIKAAGA
jgi:hypothetical protein